MTCSKNVQGPFRMCRKVIWVSRSLSELGLTIPRSIEKRRVLSTPLSVHFGQRVPQVQVCAADHLVRSTLLQDWSRAALRGKSGVISPHIFFGSVLAGSPRILLRWKNL